MRGVSLLLQKFWVLVFDLGPSVLVEEHTAEDADPSHDGTYGEPCQGGQGPYCELTHEEGCPLKCVEQHS